MANTGKGNARAQGKATRPELHKEEEQPQARKKVARATRGKEERRNKPQARQKDKLQGKTTKDANRGTRNGRGQVGEGKGRSKRQCVQITAPNTVVAKPVAGPTSLKQPPAKKRQAYRVPLPDP